MIDRSDAVVARVDPGGPVVDDRVGGPAVPKGLHDLHELLAAGIAVGVADLTGAAVILRRGREPRGHDVPGGAAIADVVDRGELPREIERFGVGGRGGCDQPDPAGRHRHRRQYGDRLEPGARCLGYVAAERQLVGEENGIEQCRFGALCQILVIPDVGQWQRRGSRMTPRRLMMAAAVDEQVEVQLPSHRANPCWCLPPGSRREGGRRIGNLCPGRRFGQGACGIIGVACRLPGDHRLRTAAELRRVATMLRQ